MYYLNGFVQKTPAAIYPHGIGDPTHQGLNNLPPRLSSGHFILQSRVSEPTLNATLAQTAVPTHQADPSLTNFGHQPPAIIGTTAVGLHHENGMGQISQSISPLGIIAHHNEWKAKYDRLLEAHRKLQRTNGALEGTHILLYLSKQHLLCT